MLEEGTTELAPKGLVYSLLITEVLQQLGRASPLTGLC